MRANKRDVLHSLKLKSHLEALQGDLRPTERAQVQTNFIIHSLSRPSVGATMIPPYPSYDSLLL